VSGSPQRTPTGCSTLFTTKSKWHGHGTIDLPSSSKLTGTDAAANNEGHGATFQFVLTLHQEDAS